MAVEKKKILVVDDDENIRDTLQPILTLEGYEVDTAPDGESALKKAENDAFNIVLLDLKLQDMTGIQVLRRLRVMSPRTMVIMVTGYPTIDNAVESLNLGASAYIMKPINPEELLRFIHEKIKKQQETQPGTFDQLVPLYLNIILDGNMWSIDAIARKMNITKDMVGKMSTFFLQNGLIKYWRNKGIVQLEKRG